MKILYFSWNEITKDNALNALSSLGHKIELVESEINSYDYDEKVISVLESRLDSKGRFDIIFSFNYFPDISRVADKYGISYVSWVYDSPHNTLESVTVANKCNHIFVFDRKLVAKYNERGIKTISYMPLPARIYRPHNDGYINDIAFVGSLYTGNRDQYSQISYLPEMLKGKLDGIMQAEHQLYGLNLIDTLVDEKIAQDIRQYVSFDIGKNYNDYSDTFIRDIIKKHTTMIDRVEALSLVGNKIKEGTIPADTFSVYTDSVTSNMPFENKGIVNYQNEMPEVFARTKINLNLSLRSITSGIPLRVMDILGAGGFCLTNFQEEYLDYFENGKELVWFSDWDEMIYNIKYYMENEQKRTLIAVNGQEKAASTFSYMNLFKQLLEKSI